jgi:hypothetical protein
MDSDSDMSVTNGLDFNVLDSLDFAHNPQEEEEERNEELAEVLALAENISANEEIVKSARQTKALKTLEICKVNIFILSSFELHFYYSLCFNRLKIRPLNVHLTARPLMEGLAQKNNRMNQVTQKVL